MEQITLSGNIGRDAEIIRNGDNYTINFSLACSQKFKNRNGENVEKTNWYSIFRWSKNDPSKLVNLLKKGRKVLIQGEPSYGIDNYGQKRTVNVSVNAQILEVLTFEDK